MNRKSKLNWPEYLIEAVGLGLFMISACLFTSLLEFSGSPLAQAIPSPFVRRALIGISMGLTAIGLIYSPWGKRSGAHYNPVVTFMFYRLGKVAPVDALGYVIAQFVGGTAGVFLASRVAHPVIEDPAVYFVVTKPGASGSATAFFAEFCITFILMSVVLQTSSNPRWSRFTGLFAGLLVALFITFEAPLSGMSMNPARSFSSAVVAQDWMAIWIYFCAPFLGMLIAAEGFRIQGKAATCAKLHHHHSFPCIFCSYHDPA